MAPDPRAQTVKYSSRVDFQSICYKLSVALLEQRPEDPEAFALEFLNKMKGDEDAK
eukprot:CAMPEP_0197605894 /NCGR_PEP_ID=MMETSP1326-20131121/44005_1 /TAXON_ID=1155430 /ORGANISM="Genus nov. species nov., Strain RCC2288" /LENGTH=55 /DNA_ID=CAMNT_0043173743 /DNA_START=262 /DNA_END=429 /DNA_ORIENTATION=-